jgi:hypothetical protein
MTERARARLAAGVALALVGCRGGTDDGWEPPRRSAGVTRDAASDARGSGGCPDRHAGLWSALYWEDGQWQEYRVELRRTATGLDCLQVSYAWFADRSQVERPRCPDGQPAMNVTTLRCLAVELPDGLEVASVEQLTRRHTCDALTSGYTFDTFGGPVEGNTWRAMNRTTSGAGEPVEQRVVFRRLSCTP